MAKKTTRGNIKRSDTYKQEMIADLKEFYIANPNIDYTELSRLSESICGRHFTVVEIRLARDADPDGQWSLLREERRQEIRCPHCNEVLGPEYSLSEDEDEVVKFRSQMKDIATAVYENMMETKDITSANVNAWLNLMERLGINTMEAGSGATSSMDLVGDKVRQIIRERDLERAEKS